MGIFKHASRLVLVGFGWWNNHKVGRNCVFLIVKKYLWSKHLVGNTESRLYWSRRSCLQSYRINEISLYGLQNLFPILYIDHSDNQLAFARKQVAFYVWVESIDATLLFEYAEERQNNSIFPWREASSHLAVVIDWDKLRKTFWDL